MMMMVMLKDTWGYTDEERHEQYDVSGTAADNWTQEEQYRGDDEWQNTQDNNWQYQAEAGDEAGEGGWANTQEDVSDWRLADDFTAGAGDNYDNSWTTDYNDTADDNYYSND